jgi:hypothetical protein
MTDDDTYALVETVEAIEALEVLLEDWTEELEDGTREDDDELMVGLAEEVVGVPAELSTSL